MQIENYNLNNRIEIKTKSGDIIKISEDDKGLIISINGRILVNGVVEK